jgi:hypothetical protein
MKWTQVHHDRRCAERVPYEERLSHSTSWNVSSEGDDEYIHTRGYPRV